MAVVGTRRLTANAFAKCSRGRISHLIRQTSQIVEHESHAAESNLGRVSSLMRSSSMRR